MLNHRWDDSLTSIEPSFLSVTSMWPVLTGFYFLPNYFYFSSSDWSILHSNYFCFIKFDWLNYICFISSDWLNYYICCSISFLIFRPDCVPCSTLLLGETGEINSARSSVFDFNFYLYRILLCVSASLYFSCYKFMFFYGKAAFHEDTIYECYTVYHSWKKKSNVKYNLVLNLFMFFLAFLYFSFTIRIIWVLYTFPQTESLCDP